MKGKKIQKKSIATIFLIAIAAVMLIPMLYSSIYLGAFWDPYGRLDNVPVAFVNLDKPVTKDGKEYTVGKDVQDNLKKNDSVSWKFVSYDEAKKGVEGTAYYAMIVVPEDFSEKVAEAKDGKFDKPEVIYEGNKGRNYVFSQISARVADSIKSEITSSINEETTKALVDNLYDVKASIKDASNGAGDLQDGTEKLLNGSKDLSTGIGQAGDGSKQLWNGLGQAKSGATSLESGIEQLLNGSLNLSNALTTAFNGSKQLGSGIGQAKNGALTLQDGTEKLYNGSVELSNGLGTAYDGANKLQGGLTDLQKGEKQIVDGSDSLISNLKVFKSNLTSGNDQVSALVDGAGKIDQNTGLIEQGAENLNNSLSSGLTGAANAVGNSASAIDQADAVFQAELANIENSNMDVADKYKLEKAIEAIDNVNKGNLNDNVAAPLKAYSNAAQPLVDNLKSLKEGTKNLSDGVSKLASGLADTQSKASSGLDQLISGAQSIQQGSSTLEDGLSTAAQKTVELSDGLRQLGNGSSTLENGLKDAEGGTSSLTNGLSTIEEKTGELSDGLNQINGGAVSLKDGLSSAKDGSSSLKDGLTTAAEKTGELASGLGKLAAGASTLQDGLSDANDGTNKLKDGLSDGYDKMNSNLKFTSDNMSKFASEPVALKDTSINNVKYYGEGLAPYFISLSLWLGSMFINLILSIAKRTKVFDDKKLLNSFGGKFAAGASMAIGQALLLSFVLVHFLKIDATSITNFYLTNMLIAVVFFSVMYGVSHAIGLIGTPIMFIVFLLQLSSSGGTFPIETAPKFYRVVGQYFPMTYSINTLRMIIGGINASVLHKYIFILVTFMAAFLAGGFIIRALVNGTGSKETENKNIQAA